MREGLVFYITLMNLYHGSNVVIETPSLKFSRKELDFGILKELNFVKAEFVK
jgi:hypothetical protein